MPPETALQLFALCLFEVFQFAVQESGGQLCIPLRAFLSLSDLLADSEDSCFSVNVFCYTFSHFIVEGLSRCSKSSSSRYCELQGKANSLSVVAEFKEVNVKI